MLWYKAWLETRTRFLISFAGITLITAFSAFEHAKDALPTSGMSYYYFVLYLTHQVFALLWVLSVILLLMGGLVREKAVGASSFTLALPVSRSRLVWTRIATGLMESFILGLVPWILMFAILCVAGKPLAVSQAAIYLTVMFAGGFLFFAIAALSAAMFEGEYTAPLVACSSFIALSLSFNEPAFKTWSPAHLLLASNLLRRQSILLGSSIPWNVIGVIASIAGVLLFASVKIVERREF